MVVVSDEAGNTQILILFQFERITQWGNLFEDDVVVRKSQTPNPAESQTHLPLRDDSMVEAVVKEKGYKGIPSRERIRDLQPTKRCIGAPKSSYR